MTRAVLLALLSHWHRAPLQLFTLIAGLALATGLWSGVQAINAEARASYDVAAATLGEGRYARIEAAAGGEIALADYVTLRRAGWQVSPVVQGRLGGVRLVGIEPLTAPGGIGPATENADIAAFLTGAGQVFGRAEALEALPGIDAEKVVAPDTAPGTVVTDVSVALRLLDRVGFDALIVAPEQPLGRPALEEIAPDLALRPPQAGSEVGRLTDSFHLNLTAFGLLCFAVGIFIVHGAVGLAFEQRRPVLRTMRALGVPLRRLVALMMAELLGFALIAGTLGVGLGWLLAAQLLPDVAATLRGLYGAEVTGGLRLRPVWWLSGLGIAVLGTGFAAGAALWRLARMPLLAAGGRRAWAMADARSARWQGGAALVLIGVAVGLALWGEGLVAGFGLLGAGLVGAALALPVVLGAGLAIAARLARGPLAQWFWADTRQQLPGLSLALMALLLAMAANIGVSTMVSSFRQTFTGFLDQRLAPELYIETADDDQARAIEAFLEPRVRAVLPLASVETEVAGLPVELNLARPDPTYPQNWRFLQAVDRPWERHAAGEGVLVNEQLARRAGLGLGDPVRLGPDTVLPVLGIHGDYGNPVGQVIVTEALFAELHPEVVPRRFGLRLDPDEVPAIRAALVAEGLPEGAITDQAAVKRFSMQVFERTFAVTAALNVLTLAVAGFAILMSLLTLAALRLPQLAPVWALGLTRRRLAGLEMVRAVLLAALTALMALPLGLALAWVLLSVVNVAAFGWRLPMFLFPWDYARLGLFALVAAGLAALWPAIRLARTPPAALLGVFANER
ncbi:putative ABC transport system permease protein [Limimaricola soesokkakensis]|uniref:FtsX-like permease family protein n=1 Tax=Limimaricola soesokkakensis TaxID=1343159 RepID=A0A1X6YLB8_9RHOB|nr:FtsX-like permease family protein [Limimaricola soesokkakensis]PSK88517.1 putative ABC transport system permease protein [Limimaricola soesokkakensis]SLN23952.1 FtsX-like permease family protein [Limimaricola soesokkakensis]